MSTGLLFKSDARERFETITRQRYSAMKTRLKKKGLRIPFTQDQLRTHVKDRFMGGEIDGVLQCRYCLRLYDISGSAFDHAIPLSRGGDIDLSNIDVICEKCNSAKGSLRPIEFSALLSFLEREMPIAKADVILRLQQHSKLLAGKRSAEMLARIRSPKKSPGIPPLIRAAEEDF